MDAFEVANFASTDIVSNLQEWFEPLNDELGRGFESPSLAGLKDAPITSANGQITAVQWTYRCTHVKEYLGILSRSRPVTMRGATIVEHPAGEVVVYHYIDWLDVFAQLGIGLYARTPIEGFVDVTSDFPVEG